jgi:hypothetical protein
MNDGILFYWFMWMGWTAATFLFEKNQKRNVIVFILLPGIILSGYFIPFSNGSVNAALIYFLCTGLVYVISNSKNLFYYLIVSLIIATSYVTLHVFALYDPAKLFIEKKYLFIIVLAAITFLLCKRTNDLFFLPLIGFFIGETLFQLLIYRLSGQIEIGSMFVLDLLASTTMMMFCMVILTDMFKKFKRVPYKKVNPAKQIS